MFCPEDGKKAEFVDESNGIICYECLECRTHWLYDGERGGYTVVDDGIRCDSCSCSPNKRVADHLRMWDRVQDTMIGGFGQVVGDDGDHVLVVWNHSGQESPAHKNNLICTARGGDPAIL